TDSWSCSAQRLPKSAPSTAPRVRRCSAIPPRKTGSGACSTWTRRGGRGSSPTPTSHRSSRKLEPSASPRPRRGSAPTRREEGTTNTTINPSAARAHGDARAPATHYRTATIDGLNIFYREAGPTDAPALLLLHGFPSSSRMFRNLIPQLADAYHVIAPDYPAFGHSDTPDRAQFTYSFDHIADVIDDLLDALGVRRFAPYMMDIGAAIGFRLAVKHPDAVWAIVAQNGPLYGEDGGEECFATMAGFWQDGSEEHRNAIRGFLTPESTRAQYLAGVADPSLIDPDSWLVDQALLDRPGVDEIMLD